MNNTTQGDSTHGKKQVLLVGENPFLFSGNGNMMGTVWEQIDTEKYDVCCFLIRNPEPGVFGDPFWHYPFPVFLAEDVLKNDMWGMERLIHLITNYEFDIIFFVGLDVWRYAEIYEKLNEIKQEKNFVTKALFPYDVNNIRDDWIEWIRYFDHPFVYSEFGYEKIKSHVPNLGFFRPRPRFKDFLEPSSLKDKKYYREILFPDVDPDTSIFCFIGGNQIRKNIPNLIRGFSLFVQENPNSILYIHTDSGVFNLEQLFHDYEVPSGKLKLKGESRTLIPEEMVVLYSSVDCLINPAIQEGLSWTVIEAMLMGLPVIVSDTTAHKDYKKFLDEQHDFFLPVTPKAEVQLPLMTKFGPAYVNGEACTSIDISLAFKEMDKRIKKDPDLLSEQAMTASEKFLESCGDINKILDVEGPKFTFRGELI